MSDVFISYSRRDGDFISVIHKRLTADGHDVWVDWEDIPPTADWWQEIRTAIEEAHVFAFVISPNSVRSDICRDEIQHAIDNNKRFIPIMYQEIEDVDAPFVHSAIRSHNWISFLDEAKHEEAFQKLIDSFSTEPEYLRRHTRLLVRAKEWQVNNRQASYLLQGAELREFQQWLADSQTRAPKPTELQYDYILASQTARTRYQLRLAGGIAIAVAIVTLMGIFALFQQQQITISEQEQAFSEATVLAQGTQLAAQSTSIAAVQVNATNIIQDANIQNTQSALQNQIAILQQTIVAFETADAITDTPTATATATSTSTATVTATSTLPPTWTATFEATVSDDTEATDEGMSAAGFSTSTLDPSIALTATVQQALYQTATQNALVSPTPPPTLTLRPSPIAPRATPEAPQATEEPSPEPQVQTITYVVQAGDFAVDIAERFEVTVIDIMDLNDISNPSLIFVGQQLLIPYQVGLETDVTLHVAATGEDTPDCGANDMPCETIDHAIRIATGFAEIHLAPGIYSEPLILNEDVVLVGDGIENTILTGDFTGTIITVNSDVTVTIIGMTITGGNAQWGGAISNYGEVNLQNVRISNNIAEFVGGGIANFGTLIADYVEFFDNYAPLFADIYSAPEADIQENGTMEFAPETSLPQRPLEAGELNIGALVAVSTTSGDRLNLRPQANINSNPATPLTGGTPLLIIDGPQRSNGFQWWRVQTITGMTGWVADFDDEPTLIVIDSP